MPPGKRRVAGAAILAFGVVLHLAATFWWMWQGGFFDRPPSEDAAGVRMQAGAFLDFGAPDGALGIVREGFGYEHFHPPLYPILLALTGYALGKPLEGVVLWIPIAVFWTLMVLASAKLFRQLLPARSRALASVLLLGAPGLIVYLRPGITQLPMVALSLLAIGQLLASAWLEKPWRVAFAGIWAGLAMLTKNLAFIELSGFAAAYFLAAWMKSRSPRLVLRGLLLFGLPVAALAGWWYADNFDRVTEYAGFVTGAGGQQIYSGGLPFWSLERWSVYPLSFCRYCIGTPSAIVAGLVLVAFLGGRLLRRADGPEWLDRRGVACLVAAEVVSYVVMTLGQVHAEAYFIIQWIPTYAILVASVADAIRGRLGAALRILLVASAIAMAVASYASWQRSGPLVAIGGVPVVDRFDSRHLGLIARECGARSRPDVEVWPVAEIVEAAARWTAGRPATIGLVCKENEYPRYVEWANVEFESSRRGLEVNLIILDYSEILSRAKAAAAVSSVDVLCVDARVASKEAIAALAVELGVRLEELLDRPVTRRWRFLLYGVRRGV